jgi:hypothetical protein
MPAAAFTVWTEWWFWASLPVLLPLLFGLDWLLFKYNRRYWRGRDQEPPPHRVSYLDAGRFVLYTGITAVISVIELVSRQFVWAAGFGVVTAVFAWLAVRQARRNVI